MKHYIKMKKRAAFTMIELVFVIMILGIVSSIGAEIIAKLYENYIVQRATQRSSLSTEIAANLIANRLSYAIHKTIIGRKDDSANGYPFRGIDSLDGTDYTILEWVGHDADNFHGVCSSHHLPGLSGLCDLDKSTKDGLYSSASDLYFARTNIEKLGGKIGKSAIFFPGEYDINTIGYKLASGVDGQGISATATGVSVVSLSFVPNDGNIRTIPLRPRAAGVGRTLKEQYKLAWSAYAIVPAPVDSTGIAGTFNLQLRKNFRPWLDEHFHTDQNIDISTIIKNVSVFQFTGSDGTIRFKICQQARINDEDVVTTCKEKAVIQ